VSTIFQTLSLDRKEVQWEDHLHVATPWENREGMWWKREDYFAPLGYGGPNGSKMRQLIHLFHKHRGNATHVLTGASILSPQHSMTAIVAAHYGLPSRHVVGATSPATIGRHVNPAVAMGFGAKFEYIKVAYNPALQKEVERLTRPDTFIVPYGITLEHAHTSPEYVRAFHEVGAYQVKNIPDEVSTLIMPAGSCNSLVSVMLGLTENKTNVKTLVGVGIGPEKIGWVKSRLQHIGVNPDRLPFEWKSQLSLHVSGYASYGDRMPESYAGIDFHPTYEGKIIRYLKENDAFRKNAGYGFWIVGSEPKLDVIKPHFIAG